jgi:hypothetical protein
MVVVAPHPDPLPASGAREDFPSPQRERRRACASPLPRLLGEERNSVVKTTLWAEIGARIGDWWCTSAALSSSASCFG